MIAPEITKEIEEFLNEESLGSPEWRGLCKLGDAITEFEPLAKRNGLGDEVVSRLIELGLAEAGPTSAAYQSRGWTIGYRQTYFGMLVQERGQHPRRNHG